MVSRGLTGVIISCFAARPLYLLSFSCREKTFSDCQFILQIPWKCNFFTIGHLARGHVALPSRQRDQPCPQTETEYNYHYSFLMSLLHCLMTRCLAGLPYILESTQIISSSQKKNLPEKICSLPLWDFSPRCSWCWSPCIARLAGPRVYIQINLSLSTFQTLGGTICMLIFFTHQASQFLAFKNTLTAQLMPD